VKILEIEPENVNVLNNKIVILMDLGKIEEASKYTDRIFEIEPNNVKGLYLKGQVHLKMEEFDQALSYFDKVLQIEPDNLQALNGKGVIFSELGQYDEALAYFDRILEIEPDNIDALFGKGGIQGTLGKIEEAYYHFLKIQLLEPTHIGAEINLRKAIKSFSYQKEEGYVILQIRDSDGKLVSYQNIANIYSLPINITSEYLRFWDVNEIVEREGKQYEVSQIQRSSSLEGGVSFAETRLYPEEYPDLTIFYGIHHGVPSQDGDVMTSLWTIFRPIS